MFIALTNNIVSNSQNFGGGIILGVNTSQVGGDDLSGFHKAGPIVGIFSNKSMIVLDMIVGMPFLRKLQLVLKKSFGILIQ